MQAALMAALSCLTSPVHPARINDWRELKIDSVLQATESGNMEHSSAPSESEFQAAGKRDLQQRCETRV